MGQTHPQPARVARGCYTSNSSRGAKLRRAFGRPSRRIPGESRGDTVSWFTVIRHLGKALRSLSAPPARNFLTRTGAARLPPAVLVKCERGVWRPLREIRKRSRRKGHPHSWLRRYSAFHAAAGAVKYGAGRATWVDTPAYQSSPPASTTWCEKVPLASSHARAGAPARRPSWNPNSIS